MKKINQVFKIKFFRTLTLVILDAILFCTTAFLSLFLRFDFQDVPANFISHQKNHLNNYFKHNTLFRLCL